jgi:formylglycine-generating enzyme required for sulfatase activity
VSFICKRAIVIFSAPILVAMLLLAALQLVAASCDAQQIATQEAASDAKATVLFVKDADADSEAEMKPYAEVLEHTSLRFEMVPIPGGTFTMGSPDDEDGRKDDEGPQHEVKIDPFWMGKFEVTWEQYDVWGERIDSLRREVLGSTPTDRDPLADAVTRPTEPYTDMSFKMGKGSRPAISMTQHAARKYCEWLTAKTGRYYRLATEAEWEYACRAGSKTAYSFGDDPEELGDYAWFRENSEGKYQKVGQKKPNPWGLHDMHGNVAEWVLDQYDEEFYASSEDSPVVNPLLVPLTEYPRVVRGGSFLNTAKKLRSASRTGSEEEWKEQDPQIPQSIWYLTDAQGVGFRVVRPFNVPSAEERAAKWDKTEPLQIDPE